MFRKRPRWFRRVQRESEYIGKRMLRMELPGRRPEEDLRLDMWMQLQVVSVRE